MNDLIKNLNRVHTTELGIGRIKNNLGLKTDDAVAWCQTKIKNADRINRKGKNWYVSVDDMTITINAYSYTIITAHRKAKES